MSFSTKPTFIHHSDWDSKTRAHPAMKFMEDYTRNIIDSRKWEIDPKDWHTSDFEYFKSDGTEILGVTKAWEGIQETYGPFTANLHQPYFLACWETEKGWNMIGQAHVHVNLVGEPGQEEEKKIKGTAGKEWDVVVPGAFHFIYVKDDKAKNGNGILLKRTEIMSDSLPIVLPLIKRGVIKL